MHNNPLVLSISITETNITRIALMGAAGLILCYFGIDIFISLCAVDAMSIEEIYQLLHPLFGPSGESLKTK